MAELTSGPFLSIVKSVGGLTFYRMDGKQYVRSKPVVPDGFIPSVNQLLAEGLFGVLSERISRMPLMDQLLELNYSLVGKYATMSARDLLLGQVYHNMLFTPDGRPFVYEARENILATAEDYLSQWISSFGPMSFQNAIPYPPYVTEVADVESARVEITDNGWRYWKLQLTEIGYHVDKTAAPILVTIRQNASVSPTGPWDVVEMQHTLQKYTGTAQGGYIGIETPQETVVLRTNQFAIAARLDPDFYEGLTNLWVAAPARRMADILTA